VSARAHAARAVSSALRGLRASPITSAIATGTIALCLLLAGSFGLLLVNMERVLTHFGQEVRVSAYLSDDTPSEEQEALALRVQRLPGVESVAWVSKQAALERFRASPFGRASLLDGLDENPLPASLEIVLVPEQRNSKGLEALVRTLADLPGIEELGYGHEWVEGYARAVALVRGVALAIGAVLALATLLIVSNTIRLSVYARRDEIEILALVGAGRAFVATPFLLEGLLEGAAGGLLALAGIALGFHALTGSFGTGLELVLGLAQPIFFGPGEMIGLVALGAGLGALGSAAAVLRVQRS
jgi:cell division transport system permease protein